MDNFGIFGFFSDCLIILEIPFLIYFLQNRYLYPIRDRMPFVVLAFALAEWFWVFTFAFFLIIACSPISWFLGVFSPMLTLHIYSYRVLNLLFSFAIHEDIRRLQSGSRTPEQEIRRLTLDVSAKNQPLVQSSHLDWKISWYTRYASYMKPRFVLKFSICIFIVFLVIISILQAPHAYECTLTPKTSGVYITIAAIYLAIIVISGLQLRRHHQDNFKIKTEFLYLSVFSVVLTVTWALFRFLDLPRSILWVCLSIHGHVCFGLAVIMPSYLCWQEQRLIAQAVATKTWHLLDVLQLPAGYSAFAAFLQTEFSGENLLFWSEVESYKKSEVFELRRKANQICKRFLQPNAPFQVNVPDHLVQATFNQYSFVPTRNNEMEEVNSPDVNSPSAPRKLTDSENEKLMNLFDPLQKEIYNLMSADTFKRFERTQEFEKIREELSKQYQNQLDSKKGSHHDTKNKGSKQTKQDGSQGSKQGSPSRLDLSEKSREVEVVASSLKKSQLESPEIGVHDLESPEIGIRDLESSKKEVPKQLDTILRPSLTSHRIEFSAVQLPGEEPTVV